MGVKLIISFPSKDQASFGTEFDPGYFTVTWLNFVRSGAQQTSRGRMGGFFFYFGWGSVVYADVGSSFFMFLFFSISIDFTCRENKIHPFLKCLQRFFEIISNNPVFWFIWSGNPVQMISPTTPSPANTEYIIHQDTVNILTVIWNHKRLNNIFVWYAQILKGIQMSSLSGYFSLW